MANVLQAGESAPFSGVYKVVHSGQHSEAHYVLALAERLFLDVCDAPVRSSSRWLFRRFMWQRTLSFNSEQRVEIGEEYSS
jgi:hypothetical protein